MATRRVTHRLWLLAHQDDEIFGLHLYSSQDANHIVYLTDGVRTGANYNRDRRVNEARMAWHEIDNNAELIFFGTDHALRDGMLVDGVNSFHLHELIAICRSRNINEVISLPLEGGHQDHDIVSLIAEEISTRLSLRMFTFPAYRALHTKFPLYAVMSSTKKLLVEKNKLSSYSRLNLVKRALILMGIYKSQLTTWIGLGPFVILKYLLGNPSFIEQSQLSINGHVIPSKLLYANRKKKSVIDYEGVRGKFSTW